MIDFVKEVWNYCDVAGLVYVEGLCEFGVMAVNGGPVTLVPDGGYRASILLNGKEEVYGFCPIPPSGLDEKVKTDARKSLLFSLIVKATRP